jgi:integrase/recombinase XerD
MTMTDEIYEGRALKFSAWPKRDRDAWLVACTASDDLLADASPAARWRDSSKELHMRCYGMWLNWLHSQDMLYPAECPGERVSPVRVLAYLKAQRGLGNTARTLVNHAVGLRHMLEALAPVQDWTWLLPLIRRLKTAVKPTVNHSDLPSIKELFDLGIALMAGAEDSQNGTLKERAIVYRNGLSIAVLASRPLMRRNNLAAIRIGKHLIKDGPVYRLQFTGDEMKGRRARGGPLPVILTDRIERYTALYRPALLGSKSDTKRALWISGMGRPIFPKAMSNRIGVVTECAFGRRITTHEFRHAAASSIAKEDPAHVGIVTTIVGHTDYRTTESYYIFAEEHAAFKRLDAVIERLEKGS